MESSVVAIQSREPTICVISSQSVWSSSSTVVIGNADGSSGSSLTTLYYPNSIYYDQFRRELIVTDMFNYRVIKFSRDNLSGGGTIIAGGNGGGCNLNQFNSIYGATVDSTHQLYATYGAYNRILKFPANSTSTTYEQVFASMTVPIAITVDRRTDDIYVSSDSNHLVMRFSPNSTVGVVVAGGNGYGKNLNQISRADYIYFDYISTNALYVSDLNNFRVVKFPAHSTSATFGTVVAGNGSWGTEMDQLGVLNGVTIDMNGIVYVADGNGRVQRWLPNAISGQRVAGGLYGTPGYFDITQVAFDENYNMFALEIYKNRIRLYNINTC